MAGPVEPANGWENGVNIPGWWDQEAESWYEDRYQTGSNAGNTSYAALALLRMCILEYYSEKNFS